MGMRSISKTRFLRFIMGNIMLQHIKGSLRQAILNARWYLAGRKQGIGLIDNLKLKSVHKLGTEYGGWYFSSQLLPEKPTLLSAGVGEDCSFDIEFARQFNATVVFVDPTPRSIAHYHALEDCLTATNQRDVFETGGVQVSVSGLVQGQFSLIPKALFHRNGFIKMYPPKNSEHVSYSIVNFQGSENGQSEIIEVESTTLHSLVSDYRLPEIDCAKFDIEGVAADVVTNMLSDGIRPRQIMVELEELMQPTLQNEASLNKMARALSSNGYRLAKRWQAYNFLFMRI